MREGQDKKVIEKIVQILKDLPDDYTGRLVIGMDFQSGGIGRNSIRLTKDVRILPVVGEVMAE